MTSSLTQAHAASLSSIVGAIASDLRDFMPKGDVAELRRMRPSDSPPPAFWKVAVQRLEPAGQLSEYDSPSTDKRVQQWAAIVRSLAENFDLHDPRIPAGRALAEADVTESRVLRLLRAHGSGLHDSLRVLSHTLSSKQQHANWTDFAYLILTDGTAKSEDVRRHMARHYYRAVAAQSQETDN